MSKGLITSQKSNSYCSLYTKPIKFAEGNFGEIYKAFDLQKKIDIAIKIERKQKNSTETLKIEALILEHLKGISGVPELLFFSEEENYSILFMPLYGRDLKSTYLKSMDNFSLKSIEFAIELLNILEKIHAKNIVHRDIKPANVLLSKDETSLFLIDYGLSTFYKNEKGDHIKDKTTNQYIGNMRFGSISSHFFKEISRKDDLESLGYMLLYFLKGKLPWDNMDIKDQRTKIREMGKIKANLDLKAVCEDLQAEICEYLTYVRKLKFDEKPDYEFLKGLLNEAKRKEKKKIENVILNRFHSNPQLAIKKKNLDIFKMSHSQGDGNVCDDFGCTIVGDEESFMFLSTNYDENKNKMLGFENPFIKFQSKIDTNFTDIIDESSGEEPVTAKFRKLLEFK